MNLMSMIGITVATAFIAVLLRKHNPEYAIALSIAAGILVLMVVFAQITPVISRLSDMLDAASMSGEYGAILFKALGICLLTQLASDACKDAGETSLGEKAELAGKVCLLLLALPLFENIAKIATGLLEGG